MSSNSWVPSALPSGWTTARLDSLCEVVRGGSPRPMGDPRYFGGTIPFVKIADVTRSDGYTLRETETKVTQAGADRSRLIPAGRLILTNSATVCVPVFLGMDACIHDGFVAFEGLPDFVHQEYLYYFFKYIRPYVLDEHKQGVTQVNLNTGIVGEIVLLLPPPREQCRIVAKLEELLSELNKGVESLTVGLDQLKAYRMSLLKQAFEGKLTADWRAHNRDKLESSEVLLNRIREMRMKALDPIRSRRGVKAEKNVAELVPAYLKQPAAQLPDGWTFVPFSLLARTIKNGISKKPSGTGSLKIFRISAVRPMEFDLSDWRLTEDETSYDEYRLRKGDLVFTRYNGSRGYVGVAAVYEGDESHVYPDKLIRCQIARDLADPGYLAKAVSCGQSRRFIESRIRTTAGQAGISGGDLRSIPIPLCPLEEQVVINRRLDAEFQEVAKFELEMEVGLKKARLMQKAILKRAFSGQLVSRDPDDVAASVLLNRMQTEEAESNTTTSNSAPSGEAA